MTNGKETNGPSAPELAPLLDSTAFKFRLDQEVARTRRSGGFVSLALVGVAPAVGDARPDPGRLQLFAQSLRTTIRLQDVLAWHGPTLALLMPDTTMERARRAADRLLRFARRDIGLGEGRPLVESIGVATGYGEIEGGGAALLAAAAEALEQAGAGQVVPSRTLDGRPRVLVVDDDETFAQALAELISESGWDAHPCTHAGDALQRVADQSYSALFADLVMPKLSGVEVVRHWLAAHPGRPAVLMSGYDSHADAVIEALSLGPVMFVKKPIAPSDLEAALSMFRQLLPGAPSRR